MSGERKAIDIVATVNVFTELEQRGENYVGLCPFHEERTPSFVVDPRKGLYYCFGCKAGGDAIEFLARVQGWSATEVASRYGLDGADSAS